MWVSENCISFTKSTSKTKSHISSPQQKLEDRDFVLYCWGSLVRGSQKIPLQKDGYWSKRGLVANLAPTFWGPGTWPEFSGSQVGLGASAPRTQKS